jgi:hypothetical protein
MNIELTRKEATNLLKAINKAIKDGRIKPEDARSTQDALVDFCNR